MLCAPKSVPPLLRGLRRLIQVRNRVLPIRPRAAPCRTADSDSAHRVLITRLATHPLYRDLGGALLCLCEVVGHL
jgi:hypothetical protein